MNVPADIGSVLQVRGLSKSFGGYRVVDDIDFTVRRGDIVGFLGPNGAGKTTAMAMIAGLIFPDAGQIDLLGVAGGNKLADLRARIGYLQEKPRIYPEMTARAYLMHFAELYGVRGGPARVDTMLHRLNLHQAADRPLGTFSRGMQQRACLARVLMHDPEFLMLDEPMLGLDPAGVAEMRDIVRDLNGRGVTLLFSSHQLAEMERICDRIILMESGKIIASGRQKDLLPDHTGGALVAEIDEPADQYLDHIRSLPGFETAVLDGRGRIVVHAENSAKTQPITRADASKSLIRIGLTVLSITNNLQSLEEVFLRLTDKKRD